MENVHASAFRRVTSLGDIQTEVNINRGLDLPLSLLLIFSMIYAFPVDFFRASLTFRALL